LLSFRFAPLSRLYQCCRIPGSSSLIVRLVRLCIAQSDSQHNSNYPDCNTCIQDSSEVGSKQPFSMIVCLIQVNLTLIQV
jgi:hypothetical protein